MLLYAAISFFLLTLTILWIIWKLDFSARKKYQDVVSPKISNQNNKGFFINKTKMKTRSMCPAQARKHHLPHVPHVPHKFDMDNLYISFYDFLCFFIFVSPNIVYLAIKGGVILTIRRFINSNIINLVKPWQPDLIAGRLLLETSEILHYAGKTENKGEEKKGKFIWKDFIYMNNLGNITIAKYVFMEVDLKSKLFTRGEIDGMELSPYEAVQLLSFHAAVVVHPMLHTFSNWGINPNHTNKFLKRMATITVMYNYVGFTWFPRVVLPLLVNFRLLLDRKMEVNFQMTFQEYFWTNWLKGIPNHQLIVELVHYSSFVKFVVKVRKIFLNTFDKYQNEFIGIDKEAMFAGTILHSLDHIMFESIIEDPLCFFSGFTKFGVAGRLAGYIRAGFTHDLPGLVFNKRFKDASHPFFQEVYSEAKKIDPELADLIDTCIIK